MADSEFIAFAGKVAADLGMTVDTTWEADWISRGEHRRAGDRTTELIALPSALPPEGGLGRGLPLGSAAARAGAGPRSRQVHAVRAARSRPPRPAVINRVAESAMNVININLDQPVADDRLPG